ncbi:MAG: hypothetical protein K0R73_850 [Candidatus Midichloriaceae bacterium]|jgi:hypothetical protein|nr:hypothetical protein [Candidatus Midichloriaceae bacterium]
MKYKYKTDTELLEQKWQEICNTNPGNSVGTIIEQTIDKAKEISDDGNLYTEVAIYGLLEKREGSKQIDSALCMGILGSGRIEIAKACVEEGIDLYSVLVSVLRPGGKNENISSFKYICKSDMHKKEGQKGTMGFFPTSPTTAMIFGFKPQINDTEYKEALLKLFIENAPSIEGFEDDCKLIKGNLKEDAVELIKKRPLKEQELAKQREVQEQELAKQREVQEQELARQRDILERGFVYGNCVSYLNARYSSMEKVTMPRLLGSAAIGIGLVGLACYKFSNIKGLAEKIFDYLSQKLTEGRGLER